MKAIIIFRVKHITKISKYNSTFSLIVIEGILDMETFAMLDEADFNRLSLNTGQRKKIQKVQKANKNMQRNNTTGGTDTISYTDYEYIEHEEELVDVSLEKEFDIDLVFQQTKEGRNVIELLREKTSATSAMITAITKILSDYLINRFGFHPSVHYKNTIALSLVNNYGVLKSASVEVPQAVWFYPNGRGYGRHSGKLHYHIEYVVKKHEKQIRHNQNRTDELGRSDAATSSIAQGSPILTGSDSAEIIQKLKCIVPSEESFKIIRGDRIKTLAVRHDLRQTHNDITEEMFDMFPLSTSFDGLLIQL